MRIMSPGSLGQLVQCQACRCSHIDHPIWWRICLLKSNEYFFKHHLFLKEYDLRGWWKKDLIEIWLLCGAWDNLLLKNHILLILNHYFSLLFAQHASLWLKVNERFITLIKNCWFRPVFSFHMTSEERLGYQVINYYPTFLTITVRIMTIIHFNESILYDVR